MATPNRFKKFDDTKKVATTSNRFTDFSKPVTQPLVLAPQAKPGDISMPKVTGTFPTIDYGLKAPATAQPATPVENPIKTYFPSLYERAGQFKQAVQGNIEPLKKGFAEQWAESNKPLIVQGVDGKPQLDKVQAQKVIDLAFGFIGASGRRPGALQVERVPGVPGLVTKAEQNITPSLKQIEETKSMLTKIEEAHPDPIVRNQANIARTELEKIPAGEAANMGMAKGMVDTFKPKLNELPGEKPMTPPTSPEPTQPDLFTQKPTETSPIDTIPPDMIDIIEPPKRVMEGEGRTPISQRVGFIDKLRTPWRVLERMGVRPQFETLQKANNAYLQELPKVMDEIKVWVNQIPEGRKDAIFGALNGEKPPLNPVETKVVSEIRTWLSNWADRMGMKPDERITDYITHIFPIDKSGEIPEEIALLIAKQKKPAGSVYNPFLLHRTGAEGYIRDPWLALQAYGKRAVRKANLDPALAIMREASDKFTEATQLKYVENYIARLNMRPTDFDMAVDTDIRKVLGDTFGARPVHAITTWVRQMISRAKIGGSITSLAKNLTQGVNTFSELGTRYTIRGYMDLAKFGSKELEEKGVLLSHFVEDQTYSAIKKWAEKADKVLFANMNATELVNRGAAYYGGKAKFLDGKVTAKEYREALGKPMPADYTPTIEDAEAYGAFVSGKTQFKFGALDTPMLLSSDIAKTLGQFQTYGLKQQEFIIEHIHHKDWAKLARYLLGSALLFQYIGGAFGMSWKDTFPYFKFGLPPSVQFAMDTFGAVVGSKDQYGNVPSGKARLRTIGSSLFTNIVPMGAQLKRSVEGFQAVNQGHSDTAAGNWQYQIAKTPGNYVRGVLFGKSNLPEAKKYYDKKAGATTSSGSALRFKKY